MYLCVYEAVVEKACCSSHLWMYSNTAQDHVCTEPETQSKHSHALPVWQIYCTREQSLKNTSQDFFFYLLTHPCLRSHPQKCPQAPRDKLIFHLSAYSLFVFHLVLLSFSIFPASSFLILYILLDMTCQLPADTRHIFTEAAGKMAHI